ncbi:MAG: hypothetical protein HGA85_01180 [Nanoarchaeota archaeon]|nr:hypothetical protein [Nanoarchaeota archaeon]
MRLSLMFFACLLFLLIILVCIILMVPPSITANTNREDVANISIFFCPRDMCKEAMMMHILAAEDIKCAFYELNLPDLIELLSEKKAKVVLEDSNNLSGFRSGYSSALMHNKFCVLDNETIITGSMNPTINDNYKNNNNLLIIHSSGLASNYLLEFDELWNNIYGDGKPVKEPEVTLATIKIENYFCPEDSCKYHAVEALKKAKHSIYFMTFSFTDEDIGNLLYNKYMSGVEVKGVFEERQISDYSTYNLLADVSRIDRNKYTMHHKVFIIDNETVITGSYNPTNNANLRNDENMLIIHDNRVAGFFMEEFSYVYSLDEEASEHDVIRLTKIMYNPKGKDEGSEFVEVENTAKETIDLSYYSLFDNKTEMRLSGMVAGGEKTKIFPSFSLKNKEGIVLLKHGPAVIDSVYWDESMTTDTNEGTYLARENNVSNPFWISIP